MPPHNRVLIAYVPVIGGSWHELFLEYALSVDTLYVLGSELIREFDHLRKDIRRLDPREAAEYIRARQLFQDVQLLNSSSIEQIRQQRPHLTMVDDEISSVLHGRYFPDLPVTYTNQIFLRWNPTNSLLEHIPTPEALLDLPTFEQQMMSIAFEEHGRARDFWRSIGAAALTPDGVLLTAHNHHLPSDYRPYIDGDPRGNFKKGLHIEVGTVAHAESSLISCAAKEGIATKGSWLFVTTFPCPPCAKRVVEAGFERVYYAGGYAMLDGEEIFQAHSIPYFQVAI